MTRLLSVLMMPRPHVAALLAAAKKWALARRAWDAALDAGRIGAAQLEVEVVDGYHEMEDAALAYEKEP